MRLVVRPEGRIIPMSKQGRRAVKKGGRSKTPYIVGAVAVLAIIIVAVALARTNGNAGTSEERFHVSASPSTGPSSTNVTIVAFESPQCPSCRIFHNGLGDGRPSTYERLFQTQFSTGKVQYVEKAFFVGWPWERQGAAAQKCVWHDRPTLFFNLTQAFYHDQDRITVPNFDAYLQEWSTLEGYDGAKLIACTQQNPYLSEIQQDVRDGERAGVSGTPTYFIIGPTGKTQTIVGPQSYDTFARAIENALA